MSGEPHILSRVPREVQRKVELDSTLNINLHEPVVQYQFGHFQSSSFPVSAYGYA